jgi:hypothetical protein
MFGLFGNGIKKFRADVDLTLNNEYQIITDHDKNNWFPGLLKYIEIIDSAKESGMNEEEVAMHIAVIYYCGLLKHGHKEIAENLYQRIASIVKTRVSNHQISEDCWKKHLRTIVTEGIKYGIR